MRPTPNYALLVKLLPLLRRLPDATGETTLTPEEAAQINSFGFVAESGEWKCPPLPPQLTRDNPLLESLSAGWNDQSVLSAITRIEASVELESCTQQVGQVRVVQQPPADWIEACLRQRQVERPVLPYGKDPDERLIKDLVSKMRKRAERLGGPMRRRRWQQLYWRYPARIFNRALGLMVRDRRIFMEIR